MDHIVLLGDSIFDNGVYVVPDPDVAQQLQEAISPDAKVTSLAIDGAITENISEQIERLPRDATHLFLSVGGNDALRLEPMLDEEVGTGGEAFMRFDVPVIRFKGMYAGVAQELRATGLPVVVCTVYEGNLPEPECTAARVAIRLFNDVIQSVANASDLGVLELRAICNSPEDYVNLIEPSAAGGEKIARSIAEYFYDRLRQP